MSRRVLFLASVVVVGCGGGGGPATPSAPVAHAGADRSVAEGLVATLDASGSTDADDDIVAFAWTQVAGPAVTILDADAMRARFTAPLVDAPTTIELAVEVTDATGLTSSDTVVLTIDEVDTTPDAFMFADVGDAEAGAAVTSGPVTLTGFNAPLAISVVGGEYAIDSETEFTDVPGTVESTDVIRLRVTAASAGATTVTITIGGVSTTWTVTTAVPEGAPSAELHFPVGAAEMASDVIRVRGHASAAPGRFVYDVSIDHATGVTTASIGVDGTFRADVPLVSGPNTLVVRVTDDMGGVNEAAATAHVRRDHPIRAVTAMAWDENRGRIVAMDNIQDPGYYRKSAVLVGLDTSTGATTVISGPTRGAGPTWRGVHDIVIVGDTAYVLDTIQNTVFGVSLVTGDRVVVTSASVGTGALGTLRKLAYDASRTRLVVTANGNTASLIAISLANGNRTTLAGTGVGSGPSMLSASQVLVDGDVAYVHDTSSFQIVRINLVSLVRATLSANGDGKGEDFGFSGGTSILGGMAVSGGTLYVSDFYGHAVRAVDTSTGARTIVSGPMRGTGVTIDSAEEIIHRAANDIIYVADAPTGRIVSVSIATGDRTVLHESAPFPGYGNGLYMPSAVAMSPDGRYAYVGERVAGRVFRVELATAAVTRISQNGAGYAGPDVMYGTQIAFDGPRNRLLYSDSNKLLVAVDLATGARTVVSGTRGAESVGAGPELQFVQTFDLDEATGTAYLGDYLFTSMYEPHISAVSVTTGDRTHLYDGVMLPSPRIWEPCGIVVDHTRGVLFAVDTVADVLWRMDISGSSPAAPTAFSSGDDPADPMDAVVGTGADFEYPGMLVHDATRNEIYLWDDVHMRLLGIDDETGNRTVRSGHDVGRGIAFAIPATYTPLENTDNPYDMIAIGRGPTPGTIIGASNMHNSLLVIDVESGDRVRIMP